MELLPVRSLERGLRTAGWSRSGAQGALGLGLTAHPWDCQQATQVVESDAVRAQFPRCPTCHLPQLSLPKTEPFRTRPHALPASCLPGPSQWPPSAPTQLSIFTLDIPLSGMLFHSSLHLLSTST